LVVCALDPPTVLGAEPVAVAEELLEPVGVDVGLWVLTAEPTPGTAVAGAAMVWAAVTGLDVPEEPVTAFESVAALFAGLATEAGPVAGSTEVRRD
jgi:hypothetical protein